ncbi:transporter substrate-binding domain-containing protein [Chromobacterium violaceum]|uniref:transporter substrate-binding domain-containing protein n=1 Tax=Chromobacterium violaceum TaxID=536 RepID=UPI001E4DB25F|nr:transporter substrate-binding domain-containing protein [Chromobacterium violaceum]MCD0493705.1 transporter substrate-binding domain-containing protein [Chromobacterium violaceum]
MFSWKSTLFILHSTSRYILFFPLAFIHHSAHAQTEVIVASETWAQLIYSGENGKPAGPIVDFVNKMNKVQNRYNFKFIIIPKLRLNKFFIEKRADVYPFRTTKWTENELKLQSTKTIATSGDVYIAKKENKYGGEAVFSNIKSKKIAGVLGYHYNIFKNNPDERCIKENFQVELLPSNEAVVKFILSGRAEVGIVPETIIGEYMENKTIKNQLIVSKIFDSRVELSNLVRENGPISAEEMNIIIDKMESNGDIKKFKVILHIGEFVH